MAPKEIPDRWEPYIPIGSPVQGTRFIALKVPLKEHICAKLQPKLRWTVDILTKTYPDIGMIVDFTLTKRYYDYVDVLNKGVDYCKVAIPGQQLPSESLVKRFFAAVDFYLDRRRDDSLIGIHCTHGVNRTGYMIARYMIQRMGFSVSDALESITVARGHPIERENYISDLTRHLEKMPKVLDGSDIHRGRATGEPPRMSLGVKVVKKKKPLEPRTGASKRTARKRRQAQLFLKQEILKRQKQLEGIQSVQQTNAPCEVVVIDSDSEDNIETSFGEGTEERSKLERRILKKISVVGETVSGLPIKVRNLEELLSTDDSRRSNVGPDGQFPGPSSSEERTPDAGEGICIKNFFSFADGRLKDQLQTAESRPTTKTSDVQNFSDSIDVDATQSSSSGSQCSGNQTIHKLKLPDQYVQHRSTMVTPKVPGLSHGEVGPVMSVDSANPVQQSDPNCTEKVLSVSKTMASVNLEYVPGPRMEMGTLKSPSADNIGNKNEISTLVTVEAKPSDVRVAIRVKDISLLTDKSLKSDDKTVGYELKTDRNDSGIISESSSETFGSTLLDVPNSGNTSSTSVAVGKLTNDKVVIRVRDISSLTYNPVGNQPNNCIDRVERLHSNPKILKPESSTGSRDNLLPGLSGSVGSISSVVPVNSTSSVRLSVRVKDISSLSIKPGGNAQIMANRTKINARNAKGRRPHVSGPENLHANSTVDHSSGSVKCKNPVKLKKSKKHKPNKVDSQLSSNFQNFREPRQMQIPAQSSADSIDFSVGTPRPHFYSERGSSSLVDPRLQNQYTAFIRNQNLDKAVIQQMRIQRRKLRKFMRRQWKQSQQNCNSSHVPSDSNQTNPHLWRSSKNQPQSSVFHRDSTQFRNLQLSDTRSMTFPLSSDGLVETNRDIAPQQRLDGMSGQFGQAFGVASGSISRDNRIQRSFVSKPDDSTYASEFQKNLNSSSKPTSEVGAVGGGKRLSPQRLVSNIMPTTKCNSDTINNLSSTSTFQAPSWSSFASQSSTKSEKTTTPSSFGVKSSKDTPAASSASELSKMPSTSGSSSKPPSSETPSNKVSSASVANPHTSSTAKLPWTALSDTSWSSLFYK